MGFFDKLGAGLTNAGRTMSQSAKNFSESNALQKQINEEKRNIQAKMSEIAEQYYEKYKDDAGSEFFEQMDSITNSHRRIAELEEEIQAINARRAELVPIPQDAPAAPAAPAQNKPTAMVCMQCGQTYEPGQTFCQNCGQKLTPQFPNGGTVPPEMAQSIPTQVPTPQPAAPAAPVADAPAPAADAAPEKSAPAGRTCPKCNAPVPDDSSFCAMCGEKLN